MLVTDMRKSMQGIVGRLPATPATPHPKSSFHWSLGHYTRCHWPRRLVYIYTISGEIRRTLCINLGIEEQVLNF